MLKENKAFKIIGSIFRTNTTYCLLDIPLCTLAVKNSSLKKSREPRKTTLALFLACRAATSSVFLPTAWGY